MFPGKVTYIFRIFFVSAVLAAISLPILDLIFDQEAAASRIARVLSEKNVDILFFGDTVIRSYETGEKDTGIDSLLADKGHYSLLSATNAATRRARFNNPEYSPIVYQDYIDIVAKSRHKPRIVIIPINIQSFSEACFTSPKAQFHLERLKARLRYVRFSTDDFMEYLQYKFTNKLKKEDSLWFNSEVVSGGNSLGIRGKITYEMELSPRYAPDSIQTKIKLMRQFEYRHMNIINRKHKMFDYLDKTIDTAKANGIKIICYITPVNFEDGDKYLGDIFTKRVKDNVSIISKYLIDKEVDFLDLSFSVSSSCFIDKDITCAHLNFDGRSYVADKINNLIKDKLL